MNKRCVKESQIFSGHLGEFFGFSEIIIFHIFVLESRSNFVNRVPTVLRPSLSPIFLQAGSPRKPQRKVARRRRGKLCSFRWFWVGKSHFSFTQNVWKLKIFLAPTGLSTEIWTLR